MLELSALHKSNAEFVALADSVRAVRGIFFPAHDIFAVESRRLRLRLYLGFRTRRKFVVNANRLARSRRSYPNRIAKRHNSIVGGVLLHVERKSLRVFARAIFRLARKARLRHCQHGRVYPADFGNRQPGEHVAENFASRARVDFRELLPVRGKFADEYALADGLLQLHVDGVLPIIFSDAVCQSVALA